MTTLNRQTVASILTAHADDLRTRQFELVPIPDELDQVDCTADLRELLVIESYNDLQFLADPRSQLQAEYPDLNKILSFKPGHMVCAGGAVASSILQPNDYTKGDADIFFYDLSVEEAEETIRSIFTWVAEEKEGLWYGLRNQNVTTLWILDEDMRRLDLSKLVSFTMNEGKKYQFIHRVFPTKGSVIGGFDISACMFLYDGFEISGLPLSLFALRTGYIIADLSRRSPSFEMRLKKYSKRYGFGIVLACMSNKEIEQFVQNSPFPIAEGCYGVTISVGGCLRINVKDKGSLVELASRLYKNHRNEVSDYDSGECDYSKLATVNAISIIQGKTSLLSWGGDSLEEIFDQPDLSVLGATKLKERFALFNEKSAFKDSDMSTMYRWLGPERCYKAGSAIKRSAYPDVKFSSIIGEIFIKIGKKKQTKRRVEPFNPDEEHNHQWPRLTDREIDTLLQVVSFRYQQHQTMLTKLAQDKRCLVTWLGRNDNPGRQFTASFNPNADVRGWYNPKMARPLRIGIPHEVFIQLKLLQKYGSYSWVNDWYRFPIENRVPTFGRDVLSVICRQLWKLYADEGRRILELRDEDDTRAVKISDAMYFARRLKAFVEVREENAKRDALGQTELNDVIHCRDLTAPPQMFDPEAMQYHEDQWQLIEQEANEVEAEYNRRMAEGEAARALYLEEHADEIAATKAYNAKIIARLPDDIKSRIHDPENPWMGMGATAWMDICREYEDKKADPEVSDPISPKENEMDDISEDESDLQSISARPSETQPELDRERNLRIFSRLPEEQKASISNPAQPWMGVGIIAWIDLEREFGSSDGEDEEWSSEEDGEDASEESEEESSEENIAIAGERPSGASMYQAVLREMNYAEWSPPIDSTPPSVVRHVIPFHPSDPDEMQEMEDSVVHEYEFDEMPGLEDDSLEQERNEYGTYLQEQSTLREKVKQKMQEIMHRSPEKKKQNDF